MKLLKLVIGLLALVGLFLFGASVLFERVEPGQIGVKQYLWSSEGYVQEDYAPGFHWGVTGWHKWHMLDRRTHFLTFSEPEGQSGPARRYENAREELALAVRTRDNNQVSVDVTVTYHIIPGEAHKLVAKGNKGDYRERVAETVKGKLRDELANLSTESFYDTEERLELTRAILPRLEIAMSEFNVRPTSILIRAVRFLETYEEELQHKQLTQQLTELAKSQRKVEDALKATGKIEKETEALEKQSRAEWDKKLQDARSTNEVLVATILAEANIYENQVRPQADAQYETLMAEGKLAIAKAEALRDELRNEALDSLGGRIMQARDAAQNLQFDSVTLNSNDPAVPSVIEIDKLVELLIGHQE
jgi:regulator of protease activity HflC (stomatin/prohibitin superfamily)